MEKEQKQVVKLVFLDIDGVLVTLDSLHNGESGLRASFDVEAVENFNVLISQSGAKVVVSSDWRIGKDVATLQEMLDVRGVKCEVIGLTPWLPMEKSRGWEIRAWLQEYTLTLREDFIIIDDRAVMNPYGDRLVKTQFEFGFTKKDLDKALALFAAGETHELIRD